MKLIRLARGRETVVAEGSRKSLNNRLKQLRGSTRGGCSGQHGRKYPVEYKIAENAQ